jgi:hypothetical protein
MNNHHMLHYKPGLTMDAPVTVTLAAADWAILMMWHSALDNETEGAVQHIVYGAIVPQLTDALYTQESVKTAKAMHAEYAARQDPVQQLFQSMGVTPPPLTPDLFTETVPETVHMSLLCRMQQGRVHTPCSSRTCDNTSHAPEGEFCPESCECECHR